MAGTDALTGARYPGSADSPNVSQDIQNAVNDLSDIVGGIFTTTSARDTAFSTWVSQGNTMRDGLMCRVAGYPLIYRGGSWHGTTNVPLSVTTADGTLYTSTHDVMTTSTPSVPFSYVLKTSGAVLLAQLGVSTGVHAEVRVGGVTIAPAGVQLLNQGASNITGALLNTGGLGCSGTLNGVQTVTLTIVKDAGPAGNGFQCNTTSAYNMLAIELVPV